MERMKRTSNKVLNYPGHIDCRNQTVDDRLEWESKFSVKLRAILRGTRLRLAPQYHALIQTRTIWKGN